MAADIDGTIPEFVKVCPHCAVQFCMGSRSRSLFEKQKYCSRACAVAVAITARDPSKRVTPMEIGSRWGMWTVLANAKRGDWNCRCDCGTVSIVRGTSLRSGNSKGCGCRVPELSRERGKLRRTHGMTKSPEFKAWRSLRYRCQDSSCRSYPNYGGRGITVCERWNAGFEAFYEDMGPRPSKDHSIDRIDVDGNYEPGNCRWATQDIQAANKRSNRYITYRGEVMALSSAAKLAGLPWSTVYSRIRKGADEDHWFAPVQRG